MAPRNRGLFEKGQALREQIRAMLMAHAPGLPPLTAKVVQVRLTRVPAPSLRAIRWHMNAIRAECLRNIATAAIHQSK